MGHFRFVDISLLHHNLILGPNIHEGHVRSHVTPDTYKDKNAHASVISRLNHKAPGASHTGASGCDCNTNAVRTPRPWYVPHTDWKGVHDIMRP